MSKLTFTPSIYPPPWILSQEPFEGPSSSLVAGLSLLLSSALILTGPLFNASLLFTSLLYMILCVSFVGTIKLLGGNGRVATFAALVILAHPLLNETRSGIVREAGYWALCLLALKQLISYARSPGWLSQLRWLTYTGIAGLFCVEGLLFTALSPLALLFTLPRRQRLKGMLRLLVPALVLVGVLIAIGVATGRAGLDTRLNPALWQGTNPAATVNKLWNDFVAVPGVSIPGAAAENTGLVAFGALLTLVLVTVLRALGLPVLALMAWGHWRRWTLQIPAPARIIINLHLVVCLLSLVTAGILGTAPGVRQSGLAVIFLLLYFPFVLDAFWSQARPGLLMRGLIIAVLISLAADSLHEHQQQQAYIAEAGAWLRQNTEADSSLLSNVERLIWLHRLRGGSSSSAGPVLAEIFTDDLWQRHRYMAIWEKRGALSGWYSVAKAPGIRVRRIFLNQQGSYQIAILENSDYREDLPESSRGSQ
jgi:hypothetical protein